MKMIQCKFFNKKCKMLYFHHMIFMQCTLKKNTIYIVNSKRENIGCIIIFFLPFLWTYLN